MKNKMAKEIIDFLIEREKEHTLTSRDLEAAIMYLHIKYNKTRTYGRKLIEGLLNVKILSFNIDTKEYIINKDIIKKFYSEV